MHPATSNVPGNDTAGTWARVAEPLAGPNWGAHFLPRIVAANAPVSLGAHAGTLEVTAQQAMTITSSHAGITVQARQDILLASGGGYIKLSGGNIDIHCPAGVSVKGGTHSFLGAGNKTPALPVLPDATMKDPPHWIALHYLDPGMGHQRSGKSQGTEHESVDMGCIGADLDWLVPFPWISRQRRPENLLHLRPPLGR